MVKKLCTPNPNEATDEFIMISLARKRRIDLSYTAVVTTPVPHSEHSESETYNIDLTSEKPLMLNGFTNAYELIKL
jgi:hypothetical protein